MIEFNIKICIDTQDIPRAYNELRQALNFTGLDVTITDQCKANGSPVATAHLNRAAWEWVRDHDPLSVDQNIRYQSSDEGFQTQLDALRSAMNGGQVQPVLTHPKSRIVKETAEHLGISVTDAGDKD